MSYMKIAGKILEVMKEIPSELELGKLNEILVAQKLISKSEYEVAGSSERADKQGVLWQIVTVSCRLMIIDVESDEEIVNVALGTGIDSGDKAIVKAQAMARREAWMAMLDITQGAQDVTESEIIVETPEDKLRAEITALWRWEPAQFPDWINKRVGGPFESADIVRLTAVKNELEGYRKEHG